MTATQRAPSPGRISPREVRRRGSWVRIYRRPGEKWATIVGGTLIFVGVSIDLGLFLASHWDRVSHHLLPIGLLLALYLAVPAAYFGWGQRIGVEVSPVGVRNASFTRRSFTEWNNIDRFVVDYYTPMSACVLAEQPGGTRTPLNGLSRWGVWKDSLIPYCEALNHELSAMRATQQH
jgi:hypothetical protein